MRRTHGPLFALLAAGVACIVAPLHAATSYSVFPNRVFFVAAQGGSAPPSQDVAVNSSSVSASSGAAWLTVYTGTGAGPGSVRFSVNASGMAVGTYTTTANVNGQAVPVSLAVVDPSAWTTQFVDVPQSNPYFEYIVMLRAFSVTVGCNTNPPMFCTEDNVTRGQMAVFLTKSVFGDSFTYPTTPVYSDVPANHMFFAHIQKMAEADILTGCGGGKFCPDTALVRRDMGIAMVRALFGENFAASSTPYFSDVPAGDPAFRYAQKMREIGTTAGCGTNIFCPDGTVTRWQMAAFLARQFFGWKPVAMTDRPNVGGCNVFPPDNVWNTRIDTLPVHANSANYVAAIGATAHGHSDFGSGLWDGGPIGIPYVAVPGSQFPVAISFYYPDESDSGPYPIPPDAPIEGGAQSTGDRHVLVVDRAMCKLYEVYDAHPGGASWSAGSGAVFDLNSNALRPSGWTSADAAGLPMLPGLVRYDEVAAGEIRHAIRFTAPRTQNQFIWPARHQASSLTGSNYPPMGLRMRLKASYNISTFSPEMQVILTGLKRYGMILADNGSAWYIGGVPDERWNNDHLHEFSQLAGTDFEAVDESSLRIGDTAQARQP